jgi:hypothetical protein
MASQRRAKKDRRRLLRINCSRYDIRKLSLGGRGAVCDIFARRVIPAVHLEG